MNDSELARLRDENALLRQEVRVAREAAQITAEAVVQQFEATERALTRLSSVSAEQRAVLDAASQVAVIAADRHGMIRLFNTGAERLLGYRAGDVLDKLSPIAFHVSEEIVARAREIEERTGALLSSIDVFFHYAGTERALVREWTLVRKDGSRVPVDQAITALRGPSGEIDGFLCVALDLTARKRAEQEILAAMEATEAANRTKSAFLANMSHELRTPLNAIIGYSEMLMEEAEEEGHDPYVADLTKIRSAGQHLLGLINDILDISKIESGKIELFLEELSVPDLCAEVARMVAPLVEKNANALAVTCAADVGTMRADALRLRQILGNLLSNAAKFTERGEIDLRVELEEGPAGDVVCFHVSDTGIGLTPEQMGRLFQPFVQADASTTRKFGGTGLGLSISKQFAELMGGSVTVRSELGAGTTFTVRVPRIVERAQPAPRLESVTKTRPSPDAPPPISVGRARSADGWALAVTRAAHEGGTLRDEPHRGAVLIIDDDPAVRDLLGRCLSRAGYRVHQATSGDEGIARARAELPDVITLDVLMPGKDGWMVLSSLKSDPATRDIPVVMLTILDQRNAGFALGASDYLVKPVDRTRLLQVLARHCPRGAGPRTALVVDDDDALRALLAETLARDGYVVREAGHGAEALERVAEETPGIILLDLMMPVMDGFAFLEHLRARPEGRAVPVIVVTAMDLSLRDREALSGKVEQVIAKGTTSRPLLLEEVQRQIDAGVARRAKSQGVY